MPTPQETMLAVAAQSYDRDVKELQEQQARQAAFDADNQFIQTQGQVTANIKKTREAAKTATDSRRKPKQAPAPTKHPAKGVVITDDETETETEE